MRWGAKVLKCRDGSADEAESLRDFMEKYVQKCIEFVLEGVTDDTITKPLQQTIPLTNLNMATQLCTLLEVILGDGKQVGTPQVHSCDCVILKLRYPLQDKEVPKLFLKLLNSNYASVESNKST